MGTLMGHVLPGTMFLVMGVWWAYNILLRFLLAHGEARWNNRTKIRYRSNLTFPFGFSRGKPVEPALIAGLTTIGTLGEIITGLQCCDSFPRGNGQHILMYTFFGFVGVVELLRYFRFPLPPSSEYGVAALAWGVEGTLFSWHLHGMSPMRSQVHQLLIQVILLGGLATLAESCLRKQPIIALARAYFTCLQGSWFCQGGFIIYPPESAAPWDQQSHTQMMVVTTIFVIHMAVWLLIFGIMGVAIHIVFRRCMNRQQVERFLSMVEDDEPVYYTASGGRGRSKTFEGDQEAILMAPEDDFEL